MALKSVFHPLLVPTLDLTLTRKNSTRFYVWFLIRAGWQGIRDLIDCLVPVSFDPLATASGSRMILTTYDSDCCDRCLGTRADQGTYADDCLVNRVTVNKCYVVATVSPLRFLVRSGLEIRLA